MSRDLNDGRSKPGKDRERTCKNTIPRQKQARTGAGVDTGQGWLQQDSVEMSLVYDLKDQVDLLKSSNYLNYLKAKISNIWGGRNVTENQSIIIVGSTSLLFHIVIYFGICRTLRPNTCRDSIYYSWRCLDFSRFTPVLLCDERSI